MTEPFVFANGQIAHNPQDLIRLCQEFPNDGINYLMREDFEKWLFHIGATKMAKYATEARQALVANHQKLELFLAKSQAQPKKNIKPPSSAESPELAKPKFNLFNAIANWFGK